MILEWKCPKYWNINLDKLKEERNRELYAKVEFEK